MFADLLHMAQGSAVYQRHKDCMPIRVDGSGRGEAILVQDLHEGELSDGGQAGQVQPVETGSVLDVLSVVFYGFEGTAA